MVALLARKNAAAAGDAVVKPLSLSAGLADFICGLGASQLEQRVLASLRTAVLDSLSCMLAGARDSLRGQIDDYLRTAAGPGVCTVVGMNKPSPATVAAFANGALAHACDYDDSSLTMWGHPSAPLLPAVLAAAEMVGLSGAESLAAFAAGLEIEKALGIVLQPGHYRRGWHPTATLGVFGAAAGAGKVFGLNTDAMRAALGIAASMAAGLRINAGTSTKPLHCGLAARNGLEAALLARSGVTASPDALDCPDGFCDLYGGASRRNAAEALRQLGNPYEVVDPGLSPKLYPCCSDLHCAIDGVLDLKTEQSLRAADVRRVTCNVVPMAARNVSCRNPATSTEARFSLSHCVAALFVHGRLGLRQFEMSCLADPMVRDFANRVEIKADLAVERDAVFSSPAAVEIETIRGVTLGLVVTEMRGHPNRPLSAEDIEGKFEECAEGLLSGHAVSNLLNCVKQMDSLTRVRDLMACTVPCAEPHRADEAPVSQ